MQLEGMKGAEAVTRWMGRARTHRLGFFPGMLVFRAGRRSCIGSGVGPPAECAETEGHGFKVVSPAGSFPCRDLEQSLGGGCKHQPALDFAAQTEPLSAFAQLKDGQGLILAVGFASLAKLSSVIASLTTTGGGQPAAVRDRPSRPMRRVSQR